MCVTTVPKQQDQLPLLPEQPEDVLEEMATGRWLYRRHYSYKGRIRIPYLTCRVPLLPRADYSRLVTAPVLCSSGALC